MATYTERFKLDAGGDVLEVRYDGTMYVAPSCGAQHATRHDAMQVELYHYLTACGEDVEIDDIDPDDYGGWLDD